MQQVENCGEEEATVDVQFTDLPNALIACKVPEELFDEGTLKVSQKRCTSLHISVVFATAVSSSAYLTVVLMPNSRAVIPDLKNMQRQQHMKRDIQYLCKKKLCHSIF